MSQNLEDGMLEEMGHLTYEAETCSPSSPAALVHILPCVPVRVQILAAQPGEEAQSSETGMDAAWIWAGGDGQREACSWRRGGERREGREGRAQGRCPCLALGIAVRMATAGTAMSLSGVSRFGSQF